MSGCRPHCNPRGSCRRPVPNPDSGGCWDPRAGQHPGQEYLPPQPWSTPTHGEWHSPRAQHCCADLLRACGNTFCVHVAAPMVDETAVSFWGKRHWDEGGLRWPLHSSGHLGAHPLLSAAPGPTPRVPLSPS